MDAICTHRVGRARALARVHVQRARDAAVASLVSVGELNKESSKRERASAATNTRKRRRQGRGGLSAVRPTARAIRTED